MGVFEEEGVISRTVVLANLAPRAFPRQRRTRVGQWIHFFARVCPERGSCADWCDDFYPWVKPEEFRRFVAAAGIERMMVVARSFVTNPRCGRNFRKNF